VKGTSGGSPGGSAVGGRAGATGGGGASASGGVDGLTISLGQGGAGGNKGTDSVPDDCADSAKVVYLVTQENYLYSFDPRVDGTSAYQRIGVLSCETASTPQSMSVDRAGKAYRLLELGLAVALLAVSAGRIGAQHRSHRCRPHRLERLALALVLSVLFDVVDQISLLRRLCPRRTAAPA